MPASNCMGIPRRTFLRTCATSLAFAPLVKGRSLLGQPLLPTKGPARQVLSLNRDWLFGGRLDASASHANFHEAAAGRVTLPHCVAPLSWQKWDPSAWEAVWAYRRRFDLPAELRSSRVFLRFDRVMAAATPTLNGHTLLKHLGGFLPFEYEITDLVREKDNVLTVAVDANWLNVPPAGSPKGPASIDYLLPGGIAGSVSLIGVPSVFISDVFAKPVNVLRSTRRLDVTCTVDRGKSSASAVRIVAAILDGSRTLASTSARANINKATDEVSLSLGVDSVALWDVEKPKLYDLIVTLQVDSKPIHRYQTRVGFREARFDVDGFFLNGKQLRLFGLNRHELYPYAGFSVPDRLLRRDAEILRHEFNCNVMRCSHYPQSEAFLDACDELGLMVWEEIPGWQYIGDDSWQELAVRNVAEMVRRDRNHPSIVIWGVRVNESRNDPDLYHRTREVAKSLDDSRPISGTMTSASTTDWSEDVFAFDDYHAAPDGSVNIHEPLPGVRYMVSETVGQFNYAGGKGFGQKYRRAGDPAQQMRQALLHAQAHDRAAAFPRCAGAIAWCAFDYASLINGYDGVKCPGVADVFRIPKLGASFYLAQVDPRLRPVIEPNFYWDFSAQTPSGPGEGAAIFSNCEQLHLLIDGKQHAVVEPDKTNFPNTKYPPFFANLSVDGSRTPELRIDGYVGGSLVLSRSFSSDRSADRLWLHAGDAELMGDGSDGTWLAFRATDRFGAQRPFVEGQVSLDVTGPATIVGDNPFNLANSGGTGAVWVKTVAGIAGRVRVEAKHPSLGYNFAEIEVRTLPSAT